MRKQPRRTSRYSSVFGLIILTAISGLAITATSAGAAGVRFGFVDTVASWFGGGATMNVIADPQSNLDNEAPLATIFTETVGSPSATTAIALYTGWSNNGVLTFAGNGDVRNSTVSSGYAGASGAGNVFITNTINTNFEISGINTSAYTASTLALSFGNFKSTTASNGSELAVEVSSDGSTYTALTVPPMGTGTGTAVWVLRTAAGSIPATANLRIRFRHLSGFPQFRIDDVSLTGTLAPPPTQYRSKQNGAWDDFNTWERSTDGGGNWVNATAGQTPTSADGAVTVRAFNAVFVSSALVVDQVTVETNGSLAVNPGIDLTINNGTGDDLVVQSSSFFSPRGLTTNNGQVNISGILTVNDPATFAGNAFAYSGGTLKYASGSRSTTNVEFPFVSGPSVVDISSTDTITLHEARSIPTQLILGTGVFSTGTNLTLGNGCVILRSNGSISNAPTFGGVVDLIYFDNSVTVGPEFPNSATALRDLTMGSPINLTLAANATVNGTIALGDGRLITGGNTLAIASGASVSRNNGYIIGNLRKTFTAATTLGYEVGTGNGYSPVSLNATAGTFPAGFTVSATEGALPGIPNPNKLARYWTLTQNSGALTAHLTFNYLAGDVGGGSIANYQFIRKNGPTSTTLPPTGTPTSTQAIINGISSFSDWTLAEPLGGPGTYTWTPAVGQTDWTLPANWNPARLVPDAGDTLIIDGTTTPAPTITNVAGATGETIARLNIINGADPTFSATTSAKTLTIAGDGSLADLNVQSDSNITLSGSVALTISVTAGANGSFASNSGIILDGPHRLLAGDSVGVEFTNGSFATTTTGFTGYPFGDGTPGNGVAGSISFASGSVYTHNAGNSPFGPSSGGAIADFQPGSLAQWRTNSGFQASGRAYADLAIGSVDPGGAAVNVSDTGEGDFSFANLTINSTNTVDSSLTFTGTGNAGVAIYGDISINGNGDGADSDPAVILTAGAGVGRSGTEIDGETNPLGSITVVGAPEIGARSSGAIDGAANVSTFTHDATNTRGVEFRGAVDAPATTTINLQTNLTVTDPFVFTAAGPLNGGANGYVIGNLKRVYSAAGNSTFPVGTANGYSPVGVNVMAGTFAADLTIRANQGGMPGITGANKLARYWTIANNNIASADLTFDYLAGDVTGSAPAYKFVRKSGTGVLDILNPASAPTTTQAVINGVTTFSDWTLADPAAVQYGTLNLDSAAYSVSEAGPSLDLTVSRASGGDGAISVQYTTADGTAVSGAGNDYTGVGPATFTWAAGDNSTRTITVPILEDAVYEGNEQFGVSLFNPLGGAALGSPASATVTIVENDPEPETTVTVSGGNLTITDTNGGTSNDNITIACTPPNITITDLANGLNQTVPIADVTGSILVNTLNGNDTLNVNLSGCDFIPAGGLFFNGGENAGDHDALNIIGGVQGVATYNYGAVNGDGSVAMSNFGTINYTGLEPITNTGTASDVILNLPAGGTNAATVADIGSGSSRLSGSTFEQTDFANPTGSVTVNRGNATDSLAVSALATNYPSLTIGSVGNEFASITFNGAVTFAANRSLAGSASGTISLPNSVSDLAASGTGAISLTTARNIVLSTNSSISVADGNLMLTANQQAPATAGNFAGLRALGASLSTTGAGAITVATKGGSDGATGGHYGMLLENSTISSSSSLGSAGTISLTGTGGAGNSVNRGVYLFGANVTSVAGNISVIGQGSTSGTVGSNDGTYLESSASITSTGAATVTVQGTGGTGTGNINGLVVTSNSVVSSAAGSVMLTGQGGVGSQNGKRGVVLSSGGDVTATGSASITINGIGGQNVELNDAVMFTGTGTILSSVNGDINVTGTALTSVLFDNNGIRIQDGALITTTGIGNLTMTGAAASPNPTVGHGIRIGGLGAASSMVLSGANNTFISDSFRFDGPDTINAGANAVNIRQRSNGFTIELGATDSFDRLGLTDGELDRITTATLNIGNANTGNVQVTGVISQTKTTNISTPIATLIFGSGDLGIFGSVNNTLSVNPGGTLRPGASPGVINSGNLSLGSGSNFAVEIGGATPGNGAGFHDQVNVTGTVDVTDANLFIAQSGGFVPIAGQQYVIINNDGTDPIGGTFAGLSEGATISPFLVATMNATITYQGGTNGNDVILTAVAPPSVVTTSVTSLPNFGSQTVGNYSASQTYNVSGTDLTANLVVTAPTHFEVSLAATTGFGSSVSLTPTSGTVPSTPIYVRFVPGTTGALGGNVTNSSTGATTQNVAVSGTGVAATCTAAPPNMAAWYSGEGDAMDRFGVNNGAMQNGAGFVPGKVGQAFSLNGVNQFISVPSSTSLNPTSQLTIDAWVKTTSGGTIVSKGDSSNGTLDESYTLGVDGLGHVSFVYWVTGGNLGGYSGGVSNAKVNNGEWHHVVATYADAGGGIGNSKIFINGVLDLSTTNVGGTLVSNSNPLAIGVFNGNPATYFGGQIDETELFTRALTAAEVGNIYNASSAGKCLAPEIVVEEPVGTDATDNVTVSNFGSTIVGQSGTTKTYTIRNRGTSTLNINVGSITIDGAAASDFALNIGGMSSMIAPNGNAFLTVQFVPTMDGVRNAALHIPSDDADENPFDIGLMGTGLPSADVAITKTDGVTTAVPGGSVTYTIVASNAGPTAATGVTVSDTFPAVLTCSTTSTAAGGATGNTPGPFAGNISNSGITLPVGGSVTYTSVCTISASANGTLSNTATVGSPAFDPNLANNSATDADLLAPTLGVYPNTTVALSDNVTITPGTMPTDTTSINVSAPTSFTGELTADPATGVVRLTNAALANIVPGTYPVTVRAFGPGGTVTRTFNLTVSDAPVCAGLNFIAPVAFTTATNPASVAVGDFNGDGIQDIATANFNSVAGVSVLVGNGAGSFTLAGNFAAGTSANSVAVGDVNGDGNQDLAIANFGSANVSVLLGNGAAAFAPAVNFAVAGGPLGVAAGDVNNDGRQDIVSASTNNVSVLIGNGSGSFAPVVNFPAGNGARSVVLGDFNSDGNQDIAVANNGANNVSVLMGNGAGAFAPATNFSVGTSPFWIALGDFNGDGIQDLTTANTAANNVSVLLGTGAGSFVAATNFAVGNSPFSVAVGDVNGDGDQDIFAANRLGNDVSVLVGNGSGTFAAAVNFASGPDPRAIGIGDFDGDGNQDVAVANFAQPAVSILRRTCNTPPTISGNTISVVAGSNTASFTVATAADTEQAPNTLGITVNGGATATVNGVTVSGLSIAAGGAVTANVSATCAAMTAPFSLIVTDNQGATGTGTLTVTVTPNTPPTLTYANTPVAYGGATTINPATGPSDNGSVTSIVVQSPGTFTGTISVDNVTGVVSVSGAIQPGSHTITIRATDNCSGIRDATFTLTVGNPPMNLVVTKTADTNDGLCDADCSLREATGAANAAGDVNTITFNIPPADPGCSGAACTITLGGTELFLGGNVTVNGVGSNVVTVSANNASRVFFAGGGGNFINRLTVTSGNGGGGQGGGIFNSGTLAITDSTVSNSTAGTGGGIFTPGGANTTVTGSTISGNSANFAGATANNPGSVMNMTNSTVSGNAASNGGSVFCNVGATVNITSSTITANSPGGGVGGVDSNSGNVTVRNSIIARNFGGNADITGSTGFTSLGYNLIGNVGGVGAFTQVGDQAGTGAVPIDPMLAPLGNYGGPTRTHAPLQGSTAVDKGNSFGVTPDQRGSTRPIDDPQISNSGDGADIGAVEKFATTTSISADSPDPSVVGQPYTVTAGVIVNAPGTGTPTGTITVSDGSQTCTITLPAVSCNLTSTTGGAKTLTATYNGDTSFNGSLSAGVSHTVNKADTTVALVTSGSPSVFGQSVTFTATISVTSPGAGTPTGTISFRDNAVNIGTCAAQALAANVATCSISTLSVGSHPITAVYNGDGNFNASPPSNTVTQVVNRASTLTALASSANPSAFGQPVTFTATISVTAPGAGTPTGTVTFKDNGVNIAACAAQPVAANVATCTMATLSVGTHPITAIYNGDGNFSTSTSNTVNQVVGKANTTTTVTASPPSSSIFGQSVTFTATVAATPPGAGTPTGTVTFNIDGNLYCVNTPLNGSQQASCTQAGLPALPAGVRNVVAIYNGDGNFNGSSGTLNYTVNKANTTTAIISDTPDPSVVNQPYTVTWTVTAVAPGAGTPAGTVTVNGGTGGGTCTAPATSGGCQLTPTTVGVKTVTATFNGDANFNASTSPSVTHTVNVGISGTVRQAPGMTPAAGVTLTLSGCASATATTNASGQYAFAGTFTGSCTVTPTSAGFYDPTSRTYNVAGNSITDADFVRYATAGEIPRTLTLVTQYVEPGASGSMPLILDGRGDEASVSFTVQYPFNTLATSPTFVCGPQAPGCAITMDTSTLGRVGVTIVPAGGVFSAVEVAEGEEPVAQKQIATMNFTTVTGGLPNAAISFVNSPVDLITRDAASNPLLTRYIDGLIVFAQGIEGDLANRNAGSGAFEAADVVQIRRFVAGLDTPVGTHNEFQRADVAPASVGGDAVLNATDVVQTRRFVAGLDPSRSASGPGAPNAGPISPPEPPTGASGREMFVGTGNASTGSRVSVPVEMRTSGDEMAVSFVVRYDAARLGNASVELVNAPEGANLTVNTNEPGVIRVIVDAPTPFARSNDLVKLLNLSFDVATKAPTGESRILIEELSVSDSGARELGAKSAAGKVLIDGPNTVSVEISGRVMAPGGAGLRNATVTLTDASGATRSVTTGTFGYYRIEGIIPGQSYSLAVASRRYRFAEQRITPARSVSGVDLAAQE